MSTSAGATRATPIRTAIVRLTIASFSVAALMGVIALLSGGSFGETEQKILLTTLLVGAVSVAVLCYLATAGTPFQLVGVAGGFAVLVPLGAALAMIWRDWDDVVPEWLGQTFGVGAVVAATFSQACLLLALGARARPLVLRILVVTLVLAAALAAMISYLIVGPEPQNNAFFRVLGVVAILDVLGTVVVAALTRFGMADKRLPSPGDGSVTIPGELVERLDDDAVRTGRTRAEVVAEALERYLEAVPPR